MAVPLITTEQIKAFFASLTSGTKDSTVYPPSVTRIIDSCHKAFTLEGDVIEPKLDFQQYPMDLSSPYYLYSSDNQTEVFSHIFTRIKNGTSPCPVDPTVCDLLVHVVSKDVPMSYVVSNLVDNYWESCMALTNSLNSGTSNDNESNNIHPSTERNDQVQIVE